MPCLRRRAALAITLVMLSAGSTAALADDTPVSTQAVTPLLLPDLWESRAIGLELGLTRSERSLFGDSSMSVVTGALAGQLELMPGLLAKGRLPVAQMSSGPGSEFDQGNASIALYYVLGRGSLRAGGGVMIAFPTSPSGDMVFDASSNGSAVLAAEAVLFDRSMEFAGGDLGYRVSGDLGYQRGRLMAHSQLAVERIEFDEVDGSFTMLLLRVAAGMRVTSKLALLAELTTVRLLLDQEQQMLIS